MLIYQASIFFLSNWYLLCEYWLICIISASILLYPLLGIIAEQESTRHWKLIVSLYTDSWINNIKSLKRFYLSRLHSHKTLAQSPSITTYGDKYYHWLYSGNLKDWEILQQYPHKCSISLHMST